MVLPTEQRLGLSGQVEVTALREARLMDMEFVEQGQTKHRIVLQVGSEAGKRAFFVLPEKLGTNLEIWPLSDGVAADIADRIDRGEGP